MSDVTGHMDRPGAGPMSKQEIVDGIPLNYYTHPNPETGRFEVVKIKPAGTPDEVVKEFSDSLLSARLWLVEEWRAGRLK